MIKYIHDEEHHNLIGPSIIVPHIIEAIKPQSVVDLGCGIGTFLSVFKKNGINDILGIDGEWTNRELLSKYLDSNNFQVADLEKKLEINKKFDIAICLEVAEHLSKNSADTIVNNLINLSDIVVFSAAFPGQGGQNHLNEQWPSYWEKIFNSYNYKFYDVFRPIFWNNDEIQDWYKQNMFLIIKNGKEDGVLEYFKLLKNTKLIDVIHPNYYNYHLERSNQFEILQKIHSDTLKGKDDFKSYFKILAKFVLRRLGIYNK